MRWQALGKAYSATKACHLLLQKAKKSKAAPKADTWPGEEQLMKDIEGIVEDITGGDGYIKLGAVYNALGILPSKVSWMFRWRHPTSLVDIFSHGAYKFYESYWALDSACWQSAKPSTHSV